MLETFVSFLGFLVLQRHIFQIYLKWLIILKACSFGTYIPVLNEFPLDVSFPTAEAFFLFFVSVPHFDKRNILITTSFTKFKSGFPRSSYPCDRRKATDNTT